MTFSIVARDPDTGLLGIAVATKNLAVGALVPFAQSGIGAVATQGLTNPRLGQQALKLLAMQKHPEAILQTLMAADPGREHRQVHLVSPQGVTAAWTGSELLPWAGHRTQPNFSVAGNILTGPETLEAMVVEYPKASTTPFPERLLQALEAGQQAGGDKRGRQSAALYIVSCEEYPLLDLRVDDHSDPIPELQRLYAESQKSYYAEFRQSLPTWDNPGGQFSPEHVKALLAMQSTP